MSNSISDHVKPQLIRLKTHGLEAFSKAMTTVSEAVDIEKEITRNPNGGTTYLHQLIEEMISIVKQGADGVRGCGLAANQIGVYKRIIVVLYKGNWVALINPTIVQSYGSLRPSKEGCLSSDDPRRTYMTRRYSSISARAYDYYARQYITFDLTDDAAIILQHELDHLDGKCVFPIQQIATIDNAAIPMSNVKPSKSALENIFDTFNQIFGFKAASEREKRYGQFVSNMFSTKLCSGVESGQRQVSGLDFTINARVGGSGICATYMTIKMTANDCRSLALMLNDAADMLDRLNVERDKITEGAD